MANGVDWTHAEQHMLDGHGITATEADEALADPVRVEIVPDYNSKSGRTHRIIGWSQTAGAVLTVIVLPDGETTWGVNGWRANGRDLRTYDEEGKS